MSYNDFMKGSALGTSYFLKAGRPVDSKTIAGTLNDVYSLDENYRFEGLVIFVIDKGKFYYFRDGVTDDCLKPVESGSVTFLDYNELNNYSVGDYVLHDCKLYECKQDNTTGTWNENLWKLLIGSDGVKFEDFNETKDYFIDDLVLHDHKLYKCITDSTADIWDNAENNFSLVIGYIDEFIKIKEVYDENNTYEIGENVIYNGLVYTAIAQTTGVFNPDDFSLLIGVEEDKEVIKIKEWKDNTEYKENIFIIHDNNLYKCNTTHTSTTDFDTDKTMWDLMIEGESSKGIEITEFDKDTQYAVDDYVIYDNSIWKNVTPNTPNLDFVDTEWSLSVGFIEDEFIKIKEVFNKDNQYSIDDYVIYNNGVYKCITPNTPSQEFNKDEFDLIIGGGDAESIGYTNTELPPTIDNVKLTLDEIIHKLYYVAPEITSFTTTPSKLVYEVGETVPEIVFNWTYNKDITTQTLTDCTLTDETDRTVTYSTPITTNKTFTLECSDGENTATKSIEFKFVYPTYIGVVDNGNIDETNILANCTKLTQDKTNITQKFTASFKTIVIASPWMLKSIINQNGYEVLNSFTKQELTINGNNYYVYSLEDVYVTDFEYAFKF